MIVPQNYEYALNQERIDKHWPFLIEGTNFEFTSLRTDRPEFYDGNDYNCFSWAINKPDYWRSLGGYGFPELKGVDDSIFDDSVQSYVTIFGQYGFSVCQETKPEKGFVKIVLYGNDAGKWTHVARQLDNGEWTSKMGDYEDIKHIDVDCVGGGSYGKPLIYMKKPL